MSSDISVSEIDQLKQKIRELEFNLKVCRERITEHRIRADRAECYMANADKNVHRFHVLLRHVRSRGTLQCVGGLYDTFEIKLPASDGVDLCGKLDLIANKRADEVKG